MHETQDTRRRETRRRETRRGESSRSGFEYDSGSAYVAGYLQLILSRGLPARGGGVAWDTTACEREWAAGLRHALEQARVGIRGDARPGGRDRVLRASSGWGPGGRHRTSRGRNGGGARCGWRSCCGSACPGARRDRRPDRPDCVLVVRAAWARPRRRVRSGVPSWADIRGNYPAPRRRRSSSR